MTEPHTEKAKRRVRRAGRGDTKVSLAPLNPDDAVAGLLKVKPDETRNAPGDDDEARRS